MADDETVSGPDPVVRRVNDLTTTALDTIGVALFAGAAGWWGWTEVGPAVGLLLAALVVSLLSSIAQRRNTPRPAKVPAGAHPHLKPLPGPEDPGNVHVRGR